VGVDQDVADLLVEQQRGDRTEVERVVQQLGDQALLVAAGQPDVGLDQHAAGELLDLVAALSSSRPSSMARSSLTISSRWQLLLDDLIPVRFGLDRTDREQRRLRLDARCRARYAGEDPWWPTSFRRIPGARGA
jgi:cell division septal protein FtsQ